LGNFDTELLISAATEEKRTLKLVSRPALHVLSVVRGQTSAWIQVVALLKKVRLHFKFSSYWK
jgi:hypothetical protein